MLSLSFIYEGYSSKLNLTDGDGAVTPIINDPNLKVEQVVEGLELPTTMAFLGPNDILVLEKDKGTVQRIVNGIMQEEPVLDVNVANAFKRGMLGIDVSKSDTGSTYVFLYFTEAEEEGKDICPEEGDPCTGVDALGNRLYRYELINNKLVNPKLLLDLPAIPNRHNGGPVVVGPDQNVYVVLGDHDLEIQAQNIASAEEPDGTSGIHRVTQNGEVVDGKGILGDEDPLNKYYAYGIRNSFGMDFDPVTGKLWTTENGPSKGDEINLVEPGFNSGWKAVSGMSSDSDDFDPEADLVSFGGKGKYSDPEFVWAAHGDIGSVVGPTALKFLDSDKLGIQYQNDMFVGDVHNGRIYHFDLNNERTELILDGMLADKVADVDSENENIIFADGVGSITDIEVGPDGYLYVVSIAGGAIYRILPATDVVSTPDVEADIEEDAEEEEEEEEDDDGGGDGGDSDGDDGGDGE
jgi:aldose sugar dehydrogenase